MTERHGPCIYVTVKDLFGNSERITEQTHKVKSLQYTDSEKKADKCSLIVDNYDLANFDDQVWAHKNIIQVTWGYPGAMALTRELVIVKVLGFTELKVEARAKSVLMDTVKRSRTFENKKRSEVVRQIAEENGYGTDNTIVEDTDVVFPHITQARLTDAQFLRKLAYQQGFEFYVDHEGLHWHERKMAQTPLRMFEYFTDRRGTVLGISVESDVTRRPVEVKRTVRDPLTKTTTNVTASDTADKAREGTAQVLLIASSDLKTAGLQAEYLPEEAGPIMSTPDAPASAATEAKSKYRRAQRGAVKLKLEAVGDASMLAKSVVGLSGVGRRLTGNYYVKEVLHNVAAGNYRMQLTLVSDGTGPVGRPKRGYVEPGLPEVTPKATNAKTAGPSATPTTTSSNPDAPGELVPVPILDAAGNQIGIDYIVKPPTTVTIQDGALTSG